MDHWPRHCCTIGWPVSYGSGKLKTIADMYINKNKAEDPIILLFHFKVLSVSDISEALAPSTGTWNRINRKSLESTPEISIYLKGTKKRLRYARECLQSSQSHHCLHTNTCNMGLDAWMFRQRPRHTATDWLEKINIHGLARAFEKWLVTWIFLDVPAHLKTELFNLHWFHGIQF